jgi:hypothetical protein
MLAEDGGVIDDLIVYFLGDEFYRVIVNAGTADGDLAWLEALRVKKGAEFTFGVTLNARRDLAKAFVAEGFSPQNIRQFSVRPQRYPDVAPYHSDIETIRAALGRLTQEAKGGCLVYFSSHGNTDGAVVGDGMMGPQVTRVMLDSLCGMRPTVVVISACYSGVFVPALAAPNRMVLTAARPDRSSFGCGEADKYPYFDDCMLQSLPTAQDFATLGRSVQTCVAKRETAEHVGPPSEPQMYIGGDLRPELPLMALQTYPPAPPTRTASAN